MDYNVASPETLEGVLHLPADKSIAHRAAIFASLAEETSEITGYSTAADPQSTLKCLEALGVNLRQQWEENGTSKVTVQGAGRTGLKEADRNGEVVLDCGNSGTTMRLLAGVVAGAGIDARLTGDDSLKKRPMKRIIDPLRLMGSDISGDSNKETAPLVVRGRGKELSGIDFELPIPSAQLKSCVLLAGLFAKGTTKVYEKVSSRDHTERLLNLPSKREHGFRVLEASPEHPIPAQNYTVPSDFSAAAFWLVAATIHPDAELVLPNVGLNPTRTALLDILTDMGADISVEQVQQAGHEPVGTITVKSSELVAIEVSAEIIPNCIDEIPVLAVAMSFAEGTSVLHGLEELRHKESDRLAAIEAMLNSVGVPHQLNNNTLHIRGDCGHRPEGARFKSYDDHRMAMAAAVMGLRCRSGSVIEQGEVAAISYPTFWDDLTAIGR